MIRHETLGRNGPSVGRIGYGAMVLEGGYGAAGSDSEGAEAIHRALDLGATMIDTADAYGGGQSEIRVGAAIHGRRDDAFVATKFGVVFEESETGTEFPIGWEAIKLRINGTPRYVAKSLDASLKRLHVGEIDLWYAHYPDPATPIEETVGAMARGVEAGKVRYLGLSNVTAEQVRRAHRVHPIVAVQYEYSLWRREAETELLPTLRELGIALVAWSPLGNGFLTGTVEQVGDNDLRQAIPRFSSANLKTNRDRFAPFMAIAKELGVTPAQLALAWLLHQGPDIFPIPGTRRAQRVEENTQAASIALDAATLRRIDEIAQPNLAVGRTLI